MRTFTVALTLLILALSACGTSDPAPSLDAGWACAHSGGGASEFCGCFQKPGANGLSCGSYPCCFFMTNDTGGSPGCDCVTQAYIDNMVEPGATCERFVDGIASTIEMTTYRVATCPPPP